MSTLGGTDLTLLSHVQLRTYFDVTAVTIAWYDYFLTLNDEISLFWGRPWSWTVSLFFVNRYLNLVLQTYNLYPQMAVHISPKVYVANRGISIAYILSTSSLTQMIVVEMILCLRVYGIYGKKKVLYCLGILLTVCVVSCVIIVVSVGAGHQAIDSIIATPLAGLPPCRSMASFDKFWLYCIPLLVFESTAFCLVLRKAYQYVRDQSFIRGLGIKSESNSSHLISVLYRDSLLYFAGISFVLVTTCILFSNPDPSYSVLLDTLSTCLLSIMGSRVLLDVRAESQMNKSVVGATVTTVEFASSGMSTDEYLDADGGCPRMSREIV